MEWYLNLKESQKLEFKTSGKIVELSDKFIFFITGFPDVETGGQFYDYYF